jgi:hypothetical protein
MFDQFWDFDRLVKDGAPKRSRDCRISPILRAFQAFGVYVTSMGCQSMGLPMLRPFCNV